MNKIKSFITDIILLYRLNAHSLEISLGPVRHLHAPLLHCYSRCSKSPPFLEWHGSAHFLASRRTLRHVSLLMSLTSLLMSRFCSVRSCGSPWKSFEFTYPHRKNPSGGQVGRVKGTWVTRPPADNAVKCPSAMRGSALTYERLLRLTETTSCLNRRHEARPSSCRNLFKMLM